ncbi:hypothetical protein HY745_05680 [Candidatus Desantisbacteria bacterium]|nr:hypothetical protein [Candidatus Desantisbacteria bacterium]
MLRQTVYQGPAPDEGKAGVCSFCHIPHSSSGGMWPGPADSTYNDVVGDVGRLCGKCHGESIPKGQAPVMDNSIYNSTVYYANHPLIDNDTDVYSEDIPSTDSTGGTRQWISGWPATERGRKSASNPSGTPAMECSSCHNVHAITKGKTFREAASFDGSGASGKFMRARAYDSSGELGNTRPYNEITGTNKKQIFCEYCHIGRSTTTYGPYNTTVIVDGMRFSTHPLGRGSIDPANFNDSTTRKIYDNNRGWDSSIIIPPELRIDTTYSNLDDVLDTGGRLGGPFDAGYAAGPNADRYGVIICQTCHKPHQSPIGSDYRVPGQTHNGTFITGNGLMFDSSIQDLLVINNNSRTGYNKLCEACHSYRPFLRIKGENNDFKKKGHPLKHNRYGAGSYKFNVDGSVNNDWSYSSDLCDSKLSVDIPATWPTGGLIQNRNEVVCLSCHDVHGGQPRTKLLRKGVGGGNILICDNCHKTALYKLGLTHPIGESLVNTDGASWPDQANLTIFGPPTYDSSGNFISRLKLYNTTYTPANNYYAVKYNTANVRIACDTCHDWANGMIHFNAARRRDVVRESNPSSSHKHDAYTDPNHNSELCVSCHTTADPINNRYADSKNYDYGINANTGSLKPLRYFTPDSTNIGYEGANPSAWIIEYPNSVYSIYSSFPARFSSENPLTRLGTHSSGLRIEHSPGSPKDNYGYVYYEAWNTTSTCNSKILSVTREKKYSKWGQIYDALTQDNKKQSANKGLAVVVCQSCHVPHWASDGLVEYNSGIVKKEPTPHSAILLANQAESFMCRSCHFPPGTHPVDMPSETGYESRWKELSPGVYDSVNFITATDTTLQHTWEQESSLPRQYRKFLLRDSTIADPYGIKWRVGGARGPLPNANYPKKGGSLNNLSPVLPGSPLDNSRSILVCDSCHAPHAANTAMGTFILEAVFDTTPEVAGEPVLNQHPKAEPSIKNDVPTCYLCHPK